MRVTLALSLLGLGLVVSCARGGAPTSPTNGLAESPVVPSDQPYAVQAIGDLERGEGALGVWSLDLTVGDNPTAALEPIRTGEALADTFDVDISSLLKGALCPDCLRVSSMGLNPDGSLRVTFELAHPFTSLDLRRDLHVFDVRGHLVTGRGVKTFPGITADIGNGTEVLNLNPGLVKNPDGFSTFFDGVVEGYLGMNIAGNARPFKYFWKSYTDGNVDPGSATGFGNILNPSGHSVYPMGGLADDPRATASFDLALNPGDTQLSFLFVVDAAYGRSAEKATRLTPRYFLPLFNQVSPVLTEATPLSGQLLAGIPTSSTTLQVKVGDWQNSKLPPDIGFDPATANLDDIAFASDVLGITVVLPSVLNAPISQAKSQSMSGAGSPMDPYVFEVPLTNERSAPVGVYYGLIRFEDEATQLLGEGPLALQRDTITADDYHDFNSYQSFSVSIAPPGNLPPTAEIIAAPQTAISGQAISFCPGTGTGDDGAVILWEYDFDWDGIPANFNVDAAKGTADPDKCVSHAYTNSSGVDVMYTAGLRVTDNAIPGLTAYDSIVVTIQSSTNTPPTAELTGDPIPVRSATDISLAPGAGTGDPDGTITEWAYDFDWDGVPANFAADITRTDITPVTTQYINDGPGSLIKTAGLRVQDDGGALAYDDLSIMVLEPLGNRLVWDFEDVAETLDNLGFELLGNNGFEKGPVAPCDFPKTYDGPSFYSPPPAGSTWGLVANLGDPNAPGAISRRVLDESGSTATAGNDNRYWTDAIQAIRTPLINVPNGTSNVYLDMHHWFEFDFDYLVDQYGPTATFPFTVLPLGDPYAPGDWTPYDGGAVYVRLAPGGVPAPTATRIDVIPAQQTEPYWNTFQNAVGVRAELTGPLTFTYQSFPEPGWLQTNFAAGVDRGFSAMSYNEQHADRRPAIPNVNSIGGWQVNPLDPDFIDSRFDLSAYKGQQIVLEFRFASKTKVNPPCRTAPVGTTIYPPCIECMQNLEALVETSENYRVSRGWRIDRIAVVEE